MFRTSDWTATGNASDGLGMASYLQLEDDLAQEISNEGYEYLVSELTKKVYKSEVYDEAKVKADKTFKKAEAKGNGSVDNGIYKITPKRASSGDAWLGANAEAVNSVSLGTGPSVAAKMLKFRTAMLAGKDVVLLSFVIGLDFAKSGAFTGINKHNVNSEPNLAVIAGNITRTPIITYTNKKYVQANFNIPKGFIYTSNSWTDLEQNDELYGASVKYNLNRDIYKAAALDMIKAYIDQMLSAYETVSAGK